VLVPDLDVRAVVVGTVRHGLGIVGCGGGFGRRMGRRGVGVRQRGRGRTRWWSGGVDGLVDGGFDVVVGLFDCLVDQPQRGDELACGEVAPGRCRVVGGEA
jgi:hypothetical protein